MVFIAMIFERLARHGGAEGVRRVPFQPVRALATV
jgi:hypothetical protein